MGFFSSEALKKVRLKTKETKKHTILIADDEEHNLNTLSDLLSDHYDILQAKDGKEALEIIRNHPYPEHIKLIISDQRMPEMTGVEFLHQTIELIPHTKRILLTGFTDVDAIIDSINKGQIFKFVLKPFDHRDMLMTVKRALESHELEAKNEFLVKELQELNAGLEEMVAKRTEELEQALAELGILNRRKDRFFSIIAHDLRNPFHTFLLTSETLVEDIEIYSQEEIARLAKNMYKTAFNLSRLLENLLDWARVQMRDMEFLPTLISLNEVVDNSLEILNENALRKNIQIVNELPPNTSAFADANMLRAVVRNLLSNAIKFTHNDGRVLLKLSESHDKDFVVLEVSDNGVGISEQDISRLFRIDLQHTTRGTADERGTGLGLILCQELVRNNGGKIWVESTLGQGTTFKFSVPKHELPS